MMRGHHARRMRGNNKICIHGPDTRLENVRAGSLNDSRLGRTNLLQLPQLPEKEQPYDHGARRENTLKCATKATPRIWFSPDSCASDNTSRMTGSGEAADLD